jgi:hypothetical protein
MARDEKSPVHADLGRFLGAALPYRVSEYVER